MLTVTELYSNARCFLDLWKTKKGKTLYFLGAAFYKAIFIKSEIYGETRHKTIFIIHFYPHFGIAFTVCINFEIRNL